MPFTTTYEPPTTTTAQTGDYNPNLPPLIIIPPLTGSVLEADIDRDKLKNPLCRLPFPKKLWPPDGTTILSGMLDCWQEEMSVEVDAQATRAQQKEVVHEPAGVHVHTTAYGSVDKSQSAGTWEMPLEQLKLLGYRKDKNLFAAPFDWRRGPGSWKKQDWPMLKAAIERWVSQFNGDPAIFVSLSMGGSYFQAFLLHADGVDAAWKKKHVAGFVTMSGVFKGTMGALSTMLWGNPHPKIRGHGAKMMGAEYFAAQIFEKKGGDMAKALLRGFGSIAWLAPHKLKQASEAFLLGKSKDERTLITLPPAWGGNITDELFLRLLSKSEEGLGALYEVAQNFPADTHPGVPVVCMFGTELPTPRVYGYSADGISEDAGADHTRAAVDMMAGKLQKAGVQVAANKNVKDGVASILGDLEKIVRGPTSTTPAPQYPERPPKGAQVGDDAWMASAAELLEAKMPDMVVETTGDGLVEIESLAACENWKGLPGVADVQVLRYPGFHHAQEVRDFKAQLDFRAVIAKLARVPNPPNHSRNAELKLDPECRLEYRCPGSAFGVVLTHCLRLAKRGSVMSSDRCCWQVNEAAKCMGSRCMSPFIVHEAAMGHVDLETVFGLDDACQRSWFPSRQKLRQEVMNHQAAMGMKITRKRLWNDAVHDEAQECIAKAASGRCPAMPNFASCQRKALNGVVLWQTDRKCCYEMQKLETCMGSSCFAGAIFGMLATVGHGKAALIDLTLAGWKVACPNVHFPSPAEMNKVAKQAADLTVKAHQIQEVASDFLNKKGLNAANAWLNKLRGRTDTVDTGINGHDVRDNSKAVKGHAIEEIISDDHEAGKGAKVEDSVHHIKDRQWARVPDVDQHRQETRLAFLHQIRANRRMVLFIAVAGVLTVVFATVMLLFALPSSRRWLCRMCMGHSRRRITAQDVALQPAARDGGPVEPEQALLPQSQYSEDSEVYLALESPRR